MPCLLCSAAGAAIVGQTIKAAALGSRFHASVVSIKRGGLAVDLSDHRIGEEVLQVCEDQFVLCGLEMW